MQLTIKIQACLTCKSSQSSLEVSNQLRSATNKYDTMHSKRSVKENTMRASAIIFKFN